VRKREDKREREMCIIQQEKRAEWMERVCSRQTCVCVHKRKRESECVSKKKEREGEQMCVCKREIVRMCACVVMESRRRDRECVCVSDRRIIGEEGKCLRV